MTWPRVRLALALAAFLGWMGYLGYAALTKSRAPVVSVSRVAAAKLAVVADLEAGPNGKPVSKVKGIRADDAGNGPWEGEVVNLPEAEGFAGPGKYLLLLEPRGDVYRLVVPPRSPGYDHAGPDADRPVVYPWSTDVQAQFARLKR